MGDTTHRIESKFESRAGILACRPFLCLAVEDRVPHKNIVQSGEVLFSSQDGIVKTKTQKHTPGPENSEGIREIAVALIRKTEGRS